MGSQKLKLRDVKHVPFTTSKAKSMALHTLRKHYKHTETDEQINLLTAICAHPEQYRNDSIWSDVARELLPIAEQVQRRAQITLRDEAAPFQVFGRKLIDSNAYQQMSMAMRLPIAEQGALMPDSHQGYGLPIGGVLAAKEAVIPYGVGVDIGCRMSLTLYDVNERYFQKHHYQFEQALKNNTFFGNNVNTELKQEHEVVEHPLFKELDVLKPWHGKAVHQLGTSGSGNHFVEFGFVNVAEDSGSLIVPPGNYLGILAHSGSRGLGANIANYYTRLAKEQCLLPNGAKNLAWLDMLSDHGKAYWEAMNLAGEYAKACHDCIHQNLAKSLGIKAITKVENHHNFAWKEVDEQGQELIVHRKGSTPAKRGELGIIPGSMTAPGFIVEGLGNANALQSASHGAGRKLSRGAAKQSISGSEMKKHLKQQQVKLIGGGVDESPMVYKDIEEVMRYQQGLVKTIGKFSPKLVRMDKK